MWAVIKKEFKSYFLSPIGYVVVGILLFVSSIFFYIISVQTGSVDLSSLYYYMAIYGLIIGAPILTMRMFAEERKNGTEHLCKNKYNANYYINGRLYVSKHGGFISWNVCFKHN